MSNKIKAVVLLVLVGLLVGVVKVYSYMDSRNNNVTAPVVNNNQVQTLQKEIDQLYLNDKKDFLIEDIEQKQVSDIESKVNSLNVSTSDKNVLTKDLEDLKVKTKVLMKVNALFPEETPVIKGDKVETDLAVNETVTAESFKKLKDEIYYKDPTDGSKLDAFELAVNEVLDAATVKLGGSEEALKILEEIKDIPIEDGQIGRIANKMKDFETIYDQVEDEATKMELDDAVQIYVADFITKTQEIAQSIPGYYDLLLVAVEPSRILTEAVTSNKALFGQKDSTESSETESQVSSEVTETQSEPIYIPPVVTETYTQAPPQPSETQAPIETPTQQPETPTPSQPGGQ